jgi:hypothetical protein
MMTELEPLFESARTTQSASQATVDADVARGRQALHRRRARRTPIVAGAAVVAVAGALAASQAIGTSSGSANVASPTGGSSVARSSIALVAYSGTQPQGYTVDSVPTGWQIQGVNNYALTIAPVGDSDTNVDSFDGKLVVMLRSSDDVGARTGDNVMIGSTPGVIDHSEDAFASQVFFTDAAGHRLDIQVPPALHWSDAQMAEFAAAVHVNATAQAGIG